MPTTGRVLFAIRKLDSSGGPTHLMDLAEGLMERGWQVGVASQGKVGQHSHGPEWFEARGVPHFQVPYPYSDLGPGDLLRRSAAAARAFEAAVREFRPSVVHVHYRITSPFARIAQLRHDFALVSTLHFAPVPAGLPYRAVSFWGDRAIGISRETREYLIDALRVPPERVRLVYNGIDDAHFRPPTDAERRDARERLGLAGDERVVSLLGRLEPIKGHDLVIRALAELRGQGLDVVALFAGDGRGGPDIVRLAVECGVHDLVRILGYVDSRTVYWASDASLLPSRQEGFGLVTAEAMLCGVVPIRTPSAGAYDQIEDGADGFIVPFDDPSALAARIGAVLRDPALRRRMGDAALASARGKFTRGQMVEATERVYLEALARRHRHRRVAPPALAGAAAG
ncbi:MAG TPA: glycosyltransferase family 4 protein [Longimicrobiales bacterium]|nr:glycosyltransferase family 4 protein [Longimicrobiales bacterium]